jgi:hypothetical protein
VRISTTVARTLMTREREIDRRETESERECGLHDRKKRWDKRPLLRLLIVL